MRSETYGMSMYHMSTGVLFSRALTIVSTTTNSITISVQQPVSTPVFNTELNQLTAQIKVKYTM